MRQTKLVNGTQADVLVTRNGEPTRSAGVALYGIDVK
jgi:hypothetical protein